MTGGDTRSRLRRGNDNEAMESAGMMRWLLTYADMITLLLALFIILFAISNISPVKFNRLARAISGGFSSTELDQQPAERRHDRRARAAAPTKRTWPR